MDSPSSNLPLDPRPPNFGESTGAGRAGSIYPDGPDTHLDPSNSEHAIFLSLDEGPTLEELRVRDGQAACDRYELASAASQDAYWYEKNGLHDQAEHQYREADCIARSAYAAACRHRTRAYVASRRTRCQRMPMTRRIGLRSRRHRIGGSRIPAATSDGDPEPDPRPVSRNRRAPAPTEIEGVS